MILAGRKHTPKKLHKKHVQAYEGTKYATNGGNSGRRHGTHMQNRHKSKRKIVKGSSTVKNRVNRTQQSRLNNTEFTNDDPNYQMSDMVPPINDPSEKVFNTPKHTVLARSRKIKGKMISSVMAGKYPSRKIYYKKGAFTRGKLLVIRLTKILYRQLC
jgi:hypothetical protein